MTTADATYGNVMCAFWLRAELKEPIWLEVRGCLLNFTETAA